MAEIRNLVIGLLLFSGVLLGMSSFYGDLTSPANLQGYNYTASEIASINPENLSNKNITNPVTAKIEQIENSLKSQQTGNTLYDTVSIAWGYINAGLAAITIPLDMVALFGNMVYDTLDYLHIPFWAAGIIIAIITIVIVFEVMSAYLKWPV